MDKAGVVFIPKDDTLDSSFFFLAGLIVVASATPTRCTIFECS